LTRISRESAVPRSIRLCLSFFLEFRVILAAGLTPAWQYVLIFNRLTAGEVNRAHESMWFASGKALNVGLALHHLGAASRTLSTRGGGTGQLLADEFESTGAAARWIETERSTRICTTLIDRCSETTTELVENSPPLSAEELATCEAAFAEEAARASVIVLSGSLPTATPADFYRRLIDRANATSPAFSRQTGPARLILDIRGQDLLECLPARPFLVKPNREELAATMGRSLEQDEDLLVAMRELNAAGAEWVLVTQGEQPAWLVSAHDILRISPPAGMRVVNPIGCGDCVAAGVAWGLFQNLDAVECVRIGMAAAAANLEQMTSARFDRRRVEELVSQVGVESGRAPSGRG
jgi:1-phosphofructokinase family hexose kinase